MHPGRAGADSKFGKNLAFSVQNVIKKGAARLFFGTLLVHRDNWKIAKFYHGKAGI